MNVGRRYFAMSNYTISSTEWVILVNYIQGNYDARTDSGVSDASSDGGHDYRPPREWNAPIAHGVAPANRENRTKRLNNFPVRPIVLLSRSFSIYTHPASYA